MSFQILIENGIFRCDVVTFLSLGVEICTRWKIILTRILSDMFTGT